MPQELFLNVLDPQYARYFSSRIEIDAYLTERYGRDIDFHIAHENNRWCFYAPTKLSKKQIRSMTKDIIKRTLHEVESTENAESKNQYPAISLSNEGNAFENEKITDISQALNENLERATKTIAQKEQYAQLSQQSHRSSISNSSDTSVTSSLFSITKSTPSFVSASSKSSAAGNGAEQLAIFLLADPVLQLLCLGALTIMNANKFERNLRRLLKAFGTELRLETEDQNQRNASRFICYSARNSAHIIRNTLEFKHPKVKTHAESLPIIMSNLDLEGDDEYASNASSESDSRNDDVPDIEILRQSISNSKAFAFFKVQLRNFAYPEDLKGKLEEVSREDMGSRDPNEEPVLADEGLPLRKDSLGFQTMIFSQVNSLRQIEQAQGPSWRNFVTQDLAKYLRIPQHMISRESKVPASKIRIRWKCRCGQELFDDFAEMEQGGAQPLREILNRNYKVSTLSNDNHPAKGFPIAVGNLFQNAFSSIRNIWNQNFLQHENDNLPQHEPPTDSEAQLQGSRPDPANVMYLLICYNEELYARKLLQINISDIQSDKELFKVLQNTYQSIRGTWWSFVSFRKLNSIRFVKFEMYKSQRVDIRHPQRDDEILPPLGHIGYRYNPAPPEVIPPVGENYLKHLFRHPDHAEDDPVCLNRFPKKLQEKLALPGEKLSEFGWGLHLSEGWDMRKAWTVGFLVSAVGGVLWGVLWTVFEHSIQDAFTISGYMVTLAVMTMGFLQVIAGNMD